MSTAELGIWLVAASQSALRCQEFIKALPNGTFIFSEPLVLLEGLPSIQSTLRAYWTYMEMRSADDSNVAIALRESIALSVYAEVGHRDREAFEQALEAANGSPLDRLTLSQLHRAHKTLTEPVADTAFKSKNTERGPRLGRRRTHARPDVREDDDFGEVPEQVQLEIFTAVVDLNRRRSSGTFMSDGTQSENSGSILELLLLSFHRHPRAFQDALAASDLAEKLLSSGEDITPAYANGACILTPSVTQESLKRSGVAVEQLRPYHVIVAADDANVVQEIAAGLPARVRPRERYAVRVMHKRFRSAAHGPSKLLTSQLPVVRTFIHFADTRSNRTPHTA